jgi:hypothetical protein
MRRRKHGTTRIVENTWKCTSCDTVNRGRDIVCINCGSPKEDDERYVIPGASNRTAVTNPEHLAMARAGKNWKCDFCGSHVRNTKGDCVNGCGAPREEPKEMRDTPPPRRNTRPRRQPARPKPRRREPAYYDDSTPTYKRGMGGIQKAILVLAIIGGISAFVWLMIFFFGKHEDTATINNIAWHYTVELEQRETRHAEDWEMNVRSGAFNKSCYSKYYGTEDCNPHDCNPHSASYDCNPYECNCHESCTDLDNGFSSCTTSCSTCYQTCERTEYDTCYDQCDVYEDWCSYDYYEWPVIATKKTHGDTHEVYWPDLEADTTLNQRLQKRQAYQVVFNGTEEQWTLKPSSLGEFKLYTPGDRWLIDYNRAGMIWPKQKLDPSIASGFLALPWLN